MERLADKLLALLGGLIGGAATAAFLLERFFREGDNWTGKR